MKIEERWMEKWNDIINNLDNIDTVKNVHLGGKTVMNNAEWMIKNGHKFIDLDAKYLGLGRGCEIMLNGKTLERVPIANMVSAIFCWLDAEHKEPILDDAEREYLSAVIKPFRDKVEYITKKTLAYKEYIYIHIYADNIMLPRFKKGTMYKGMKPNKEYSLEELGL